MSASFSAPAAALLVAAVLTLVGVRVRRWAWPPRAVGPPLLSNRRRSGSHVDRARSRRRRRRELDDLEVAEWCEQVAAGVRAGSSLTQAILHADSGRGAGLTPFPTLALAVTRGHGLGEALRALTVDPSTAAGLVVPVLVACAELGGPAAGPLERVAVTLQARAAERAERRANSAQAQLSARVLTTVPFGVFALLAATEPTVRQAATTPAGISCLLAGATLNLGGWWWMRRIVTSAV